MAAHRLHGDGWRGPYAPYRIPFTGRLGQIRTKRPPSATRFGVGTAALRLCCGDCARCDGRLGTLEYFARCGGRAFRAVRGATGALPLDPAILGCPPSVGKSGRRGILRQAKVWLRRHTGCMTRRHTAGMAEKARRAPQTHGWWAALTRKKSSKTFYFRTIGGFTAQKNRARRKSSRCTRWGG